MTSTQRKHPHPPKKLKEYQKILKAMRLEVSNERISLETSSAEDSPSLRSSSSMGGGLLHKSLHKTLHKSLHKSLHKGLHKGLQAGASGIDGLVPGDGLNWPSIEVPWREIKRLYEYQAKFKWDCFDIPNFDPPPTVEDRLGEISDLITKQKELREPRQAVRRSRIRIEATNDLTAFMLPLGGDVGSTTSSTAEMFQIILWLGSMIGLQYKEKYNAPRPHVLSPELQPFIPVPAYASYPSNHAFQSFLIAEVFARAVPEHPGGAELYRAAAEVAENREWAGLHVASDTKAGRRLARLCTPAFETVLEDQIRTVRAEWLGEGGSR